jgi:hypothetical protein
MLGVLMDYFVKLLSRNFGIFHRYQLMFFRGPDGRDALPRDPALQVSTAFFAHDRRNYWFCNLNWTCEPGARPLSCP